jgi:hypothetical protein
MIPKIAPEAPWEVTLFVEPIGFYIYIGRINWPQIFRPKGEQA